MSYRKAIHDLLVTTAAAGTFNEAVYANTRPEALLTVGSAISPSSIEANEIRGRFGLATHYGRDRRQERDGWAWLLVIRFHTEAILEQFETALMSVPLTISQDIPGGIDLPVFMRLEDSSYEHPPRGGASNGSEVTYRFVADLGPQ